METVRDSYVAATGLPEVRPDHAVALARFAKDCMIKMQTLTRKLEVTLGPDTADLGLRMGMVRLMCLFYCASSFVFVLSIPLEALAINIHNFLHYISNAASTTLAFWSW